LGDRRMTSSFGFRVQGVTLGVLLGGSIPKGTGREDEGLGL